jgi:hypothetical protein
VNTPTVAGVMLMALPIAFNVAFGLLASRLDYPDILRQPTDEVLARFRQGGVALIMIWWFFALTALLLAPLAVLLSRSLPSATGTVLAIGATVGVLAGFTHVLGFTRWPLLVPYLARVSTDPESTPSRGEAVDVVFQSFNRYLGVAVGEHLGYALTGRMERAHRRYSRPVDRDSCVVRRCGHRGRRSSARVFS